MDAPDGLSERGKSLWLSLSESFDLSGAQGVLAHEACRLADRLEKLDAILSGEVDEWVRIREARFEGDDTVLVINQAAAEARQQQLALKQLLAAVGVDKAPAAKGGKVSSLDQLASRRAARKPRAASQ